MCKFNSPLNFRLPWTITLGKSAETLQRSWFTPLSEMGTEPSVMKELPNGIPDNKRPGHEEQDSIEYARMLFRSSSLSAAS